MSEEVKLKIVRATRNGSYDSHRRRAGVEFPVRADAKEDWFVEVGPAPADAEFPAQLNGAQVGPGKNFIQVMKELGQPQAPAPIAPTPISLAEAQAQSVTPSKVADDLIGF